MPEFAHWYCSTPQTITPLAEAGIQWGGAVTHVNWLDDFENAILQDPKTINVLVHLVPEELKRLEYLEQRVVKLEEWRESFAKDTQPDSKLFQSLVEQWKAERGHVSSVQQMASHPAYQQIIGMGSKILPLLLKEMQDRPDHWTWALRYIARVNPVPKESKGKIKEMAAIWAQWGRENGYLQ